MQKLGRIARRGCGAISLPSLRANGSRECAPHDRLREASILACRLMDCFVALLLAMTVANGAASDYPDVFAAVAAAGPEPRSPLILEITIACNLGLLSMVVWVRPASET
jgi:hypothetical protein